jgi:hypothetical protein
VVSNSYPLAQHSQVVEQCFRGIRSIKLEPSEMKCDLGLSELGEWMHLLIYFPDEYSYFRRANDGLGFRLECFNSLEGSSRVVLFLSWIRFICSNGMVISETLAGLRDAVDKYLDLDQIPEVIKAGLDKVSSELDRLIGWEGSEINLEAFEAWINQDVSEAFNKKAACRIFNICTHGHDVEISNPFAPGEASKKPVKRTIRVPGSPGLCGKSFDVSQALSWVASARTSPEDRLTWQTKIPRLLDKLRAA